VGRTDEEELLFVARAHEIGPHQWDVKGEKVEEIKIVFAQNCEREEADPHQQDHDHCLAAQQRHQQHCEANAENQSGQGRRQHGHEIGWPGEGRRSVKVVQQPGRRQHPQLE